MISFHAYYGSKIRININKDDELSKEALEQDEWLQKLLQGSKIHKNFNGIRRFLWIR
jgi:hypothetical protein